MECLSTMDDQWAWNNCLPKDRWVFDKLLLSKKLGYTCGPHGVDVPSPDFYIIRPCVNLMGMGLGAYIDYLKEETDGLMPAGSFWCEIFHGRHLSIDYREGKQVLCVEGIRNEAEFPKWDRWEKTDDQVNMPNFIKDLTSKYKYVNIEAIDGNIIEVHLRPNPDFIGHNSPYIKPVWKSDGPDFWDKIGEDEDFAPLADGERIGFIYRRDDG